MSRITGDRAEPRAARLARHDGRRPGARAQQPGGGRPARRRPDGRGARGDRLHDRPLRRAGIERDEAEQLVAPAARGARAAPSGRTALDALDAADAEDELLDAPRGARRARGRGGSPSRWPPPASTATGSTASRRSPGRRPAPPLGWVAATLTARGLAAELQESTERMSRARRRGQDLRLHGPRRAGRGRPARGPGDDARRARPQAQAHRRSRSCATTTATLPEAHRARLRAQPGVDQPARQRDRRARRAAARSRSRTRREGDVASVEVADDGPGIPPEVARRASSTRSSPPRTSATAPGLGLATAQPDRRRPPRRHADRRLRAGAHDLPRPAAANQG